MRVIDNLTSTVSSSSGAISFENDLAEAVDLIKTTTINIEKNLTPLDIEIFKEHNFNDEDRAAIFCINRLSIKTLEKFIQYLKSLFDKNPYRFYLINDIVKLNTFLLKTKKELQSNISARNNVMDYTKDYNQALLQLIARLKLLTGMQQQEIAKKISLGKSFFTCHFKENSKISQDKIKSFFSYLQAEDTPIILIIDKDIKGYLKELSPLLNSHESRLKKAILLLKNKDKSITQQKLGKLTKLSPGDLNNLINEKGKRNTQNVTEKNKEHITIIYQAMVKEGERLAINDDKEFTNCLKDIASFYGLENPIVHTNSVPSNKTETDDLLEKNPKSLRTKRGLTMFPAVKNNESNPKKLKHTPQNLPPSQETDTESMGVILS